tara:strand:+ start:211 stop:516 length:306 start_codon:yes stop_codon:yes gene_type:complete
MIAKAICNLYPQVVNWDEKYGSFDKDGNKVEIDEAKIAEEVKRLQAEYKAQQYARTRQQNYPNEHDLLIALWEKVMEGRSESADVLEVKRQEVKTAHPKPE